jgi:ELWxxDGT repeat protein
MNTGLSWKPRHWVRSPGVRLRKPSSRVVLRAEPLEDRLLPSMTPKLLLDINPGSSSSSSFPTDFTQVNGLTFFSAFDGTHGTQLWESNGTAAGTFMVTDINSGDGLIPSNLTNVNGTLFFEANDGTNGYEVWESNGTAAGTFLVKDINPGANGSNPKYLTNVNGTLFFQANDGTNGTQLWESNGSAAGTFQVADINGTSGSYPSDLTNVNGTLFFQAKDQNGSNLWESNASATGTFPVANINIVTGSSGPKSLTNVNGTLFFQANDTFHGAELWESNGSGAGTHIVADINPGTSGSYPAYLTNVNGTLFFSATNDGTHFELWESNGAATGTFLVQDIAPEAGDQHQGLPTNVNGTLFFQAHDGTNGTELWESNGTASGTFLVEDINPGSSGSYPYYLTNVNGTLFFEATDGSDGHQLWESNGTASGTFLVEDINPNGDSYPRSLTNVNGALFFSANDGIHGEEPWILAVSTSTTATISSSRNPSAFDQAVTFTAAVSGVPGADIPTGTVGFKEGATDLTPGGVSLTGGEAIFITPALGVGSHTITAFYSGDSTFTGSQGNDSASPQIVSKDTTSTKLLMSPSTLVSGQAVAFVAIISNTSGPFGAPTGTVQFAIDGTNVGSPVTLFSGVASLPAKLSATGGAHTITATYTNSDGDFTSGIGSAMQAVTKDATKAVLTSTPVSAVSGQVVAFIATLNPVAPGSGTPTGTVDFKEGATDFTPGGVTLSGGRATFTTSSLGIGHHTVTVTYGGDANFTGSSGNDASAPVVVNQASSRTVMTSFPDPSVFGQAVSFTVAVLALFPSQGTPAGTVAFTDGSTTIGVVTLSGADRATFTTASLSRGNHAINANYEGDAKYVASSYLNFGETVLRDATATTVTSSANPALVGATITFTAVVHASSPGAGIPTGTVTFKDNTTVLGTGTPNSAGQATFSTTALALGTHAITASYAGDTNFTASFSPNVAEVVKSSGASTVPSPPPTNGKAANTLSGSLPNPVSGLSPQGLDSFFDGSAKKHGLSTSGISRPHPWVAKGDLLDWP